MGNALSGSGEEHCQFSYGHGHIAAHWRIGGELVVGRRCSGHDPLWPGVTRSDLFSSGLAHHLCSGFPGHGKFLVHHSDDGHRSDRDREGHGHFRGHDGRGGHFRRLFRRQALAPFGYDESRSGHGRHRSLHPHSVHVLDDRTEHCHCSDRFCLHWSWRR